MLHKNKMLYGLLILFVGFAMSFNTATAQVTGEDMESQGQNAFTGVVVDATTGQPVANATVKVEGTDKETTTGQDGRFTLQLGMSGMDQGGMEQGSAGNAVTLVINAEGYEKLSEEVQPMQQGQQQQGQPKTFELQPKQGQGGQEGDY